MAAAPFEEFELQSASLDAGTCLLEASAGTGKTYTITGILVRMVLEEIVPSIDRALVVTFTVAAADELKTRLRSGLQQALQVLRGRPSGDVFFDGLKHHGVRGERRLRQALDDFDQASVTTIHGFCKRLLDETAFESDEAFDLDFTVDEAPLLHTAAADAVRSLHANDSKMLGALLYEMRLAPDSLVPLYRTWQRHPDVAIDPARPELSVHLDNLRAALYRTASLWDDDVYELFANMPWRKREGPGAGADVAAALRRLGEDLHTRPELQLTQLRELRPERLHARTTSKRPDLQHAFLLGCNEINERFETTARHLKSLLLLRTHDRLQRLKRSQQVLTFDDLLARAHDAVTDPERRDPVLAALHARYDVALIDEFQDTDARQYELLQTAFLNRPLFLVGDPKQSIYAFRGADLHSYLDAADQALERRTLGKNYRSSPEMVQAVNHLFARPGAFVEPRIRMPKVEANAAPGALRVLDDGDPEAALHIRMAPSLGRQKNDKLAVYSAAAARDLVTADVADEIARLLHGTARFEERRVLPRDIAVLTRSNAEATQIQSTLREHGVVAVIGRAGDVLATDEVVELERILRAVHDSGDLRRCRAAMTTRLYGFDAAALTALERDAVRFDAACTQFDRWRQLWLRRGFVVMQEAMLHELDLEARLLQRPDGERRLTNLYQLLELLHQAEHEHRLSPEGLLHWLQRVRANVDEVEAQRRELRLESDEDAVQIRTMHGSKGLQYEIVFCPFLWSGRQAATENVVLSDPDRHRTFAWQVTRDDEDWQRSEQERLAEDVRLCYVALTRARRRCYVHWGPLGSSFQGSALGWLLNPEQVALTPGWQSTWSQRLREAADLDTYPQKLAQRAGGTIVVTPLEVAPAPQRTAVDATAAATTSTEATARQAAPPPLPYRAPRVVHSFSSLVADNHARDHAHAVADVGADDLATDTRTKATDDAAPPTGIFGFARGADAGQCLHTVLEHVDLAGIAQGAPDAVEHAALVVHRTLQASGLDDLERHPGADDPAAVVLQNLRDLAAARSTTDGPTIGALCGGRRRVEWQFTLPLQQAPDLERLADVFEASSCGIARGYASRLRQHEPQRFAGYLTGFVDLVAEHDGRYWIVDWKSNHLGDRTDDYDQAALSHAMHEHDYVLQYHLYVLAWHRQLAVRLGDYDYDRHFGGVLYAFLRGAVPDRDSGMFCTRPPRDVVEGLSSWAARSAR